MRYIVFELKLFSYLEKYKNISILKIIISFVVYYFMVLIGVNQIKYFIEK